MAQQWQITCWYLAILVLFVIGAKWASLGREGVRWRGSFLFAPWLCITTWESRCRDLTGAMQWSVIRCALVPIVLMVLWYLFGVPLTRDLPIVLQGYVALVPFWLLLEAIGGAARMCWLPCGELVPAMFHHPWRARSLAEFWGRRWNRLIGDWLAQVVYRPWRRRPRLAMGAAFLVSGLIHELVVSLPLALVYGESVWGWLTGYFLIQYGGCLAEKRWHLAPASQRVMLWATVVLPAPLILNRGTLLIFHLGG